MYRGGQCSEFVLLELLHELVDALQLRWDVYLLRTVRHTGAALYAMVGLAQARHAAVIAHQEGPAANIPTSSSRLRLSA